MQLNLHAFALPLKHPFTIARGTFSVQHTLIVELTDGRHYGYGEATANPYYGTTVENMSAALEEIRPSLARVSAAEDPAQLWNAVHPQLKEHPFAQCALDEAAYDLWGKVKGAPVYQLWGLSADQLPPSSFTIGIDQVDVMVQKLQEEPGWPIYKIKLGTPDDLEIVRTLRQHTRATLRVDANCGWTAEETVAKSHELKELGVEFIEQPLPADDTAGARHVFAHSALPILADESCQIESDVLACHGHFHGINIKLVKCGGLTPARRMIEQARQLQMKVMVGCMTESSVGISAIAQLLPLLDYVDMDGAELLAEDIATGVTLKHGRCIYAAVDGNGVELIQSRHGGRNQAGA